MNLLDDLDVVLVARSVFIRTRSCRSGTTIVSCFSRSPLDLWSAARLRRPLNDGSQGWGVSMSSVGRVAPYASAAAAPPMTRIEAGSGNAASIASTKHSSS